MERRPRIGVVGVGFGKWHARELRRLETEGLCELAALCRWSDTHFTEVYREMRKERLPTTLVEEFYDFNTMLSQASLDGVVIASPNDTHDMHMLEAFAQGCNAYVEKPLLWRKSQSAKQISERGKVLFMRAAEKECVLMGGSQLTGWFQRPEEGFYTVAPYVAPEAVSHIAFCFESMTGASISPALVDLLPHAYAVVQAVAGDGTLQFLQKRRKGGTSSFQQTGERQIAIVADYQRKDMPTVKLAISLWTNAPQRKLEIAVNDAVVRQEIVQGPPYKVFLMNGTGRHEVVNPLYAALRTFVTTLQKPAEERLGASTALLRNHTMICETIAAYRNSTK